MNQDAPRSPGTTATATRGVGALLRVPGLPDVALPALLRFSAADPFAVRMVLLLAAVDGEPDSVEWVFSRSLLTDGLVGPTGAGDVRVQVVGREVSVELAGSATVLLPLEGMVEFLAASYDVVPTGAESAELSLEQALAALLA